MKDQFDLTCIAVTNIMFNTIKDSQVTFKKLKDSLEQVYAMTHSETMLSELPLRHTMLHYGKLR